MPACGLCLQYCPFTHTFSLFPSAIPFGPPNPSSGPPALHSTPLPPKPPWFLQSVLSSSSPWLSGLESLQAKCGPEIVNPAFLSSFHHFGIFCFCGYWVAVQPTRYSSGLRATMNSTIKSDLPLTPGSWQWETLSAEGWMLSGQVLSLAGNPTHSLIQTLTELCRASQRQADPPWGQKLVFKLSLGASPQTHLSVGWHGAYHSYSLKKIQPQQRQKTTSEENQPEGA